MKNKNNNKIIIVLVLALVFAIAAGVCIVTTLSPQRTKVYVFNSAYEAGTTITQDMLTTVEVDSTIIVAKAKNNISDYFITDNTISDVLKSKESLKISVSNGTPLMKSMLSITGGNSIEMSMSPSMIAISVGIDNITGITSDLTSGTSVNVYAIPNSGTPYLLFENMRLLEVSKNESSDTLYSATLEVDNAQAIKLLEVTSTGSLYLGIVNSSGYQYTLGSDEEQQTIEIVTTENVASEETTEEVAEETTPEETGEDTIVG